jgi:predicted amidohydrolase YtcJ
MNTRKSDRAIDAHGKYLLPDFVDSHPHIHAINSEQGVPADYILKLRMGHNITRVRALFAASGETQSIRPQQLTNAVDT